MAVTPEEIVERYPVLYHMAAPGSWPSIEQHGLLSTSSLLDLFCVCGEQRLQIEERHRPEGVTIEHPAHGVAVVRDQKPMDDLGLERALEGTDLTPRDWYLILNEKVFFWVRRERLDRMMGARAYKAHPKTVLCLCTEELLMRHAGKVMLAPMNTGCTKPWPHERGPSTFLPLDEYPFAESRRKRGVNAIVELAVVGAVPDVRDLVIRVEAVEPSGDATILFER